MKGTLIAAAAVAALFSATTWAQMGPGMMGGGPGMWGDIGTMGWGWGMLGVVGTLLWWVLIVLGIVVLAKWLFGSGSRDRRGTGGNALEILKERYARGEIGKDEYEQKKRDLSA